MPRLKLEEKLISSNVNDECSPQERKFVEALVSDPKWNLTKAAEVAGYKNPRVMGQKLVKRKRINLYLGHFLGKRRESAELTSDDVLRELAYALKRDPVDLVDEEGRFYTNLNEIPEKLRHCIDGIEVEQLYDDGEVVGHRIKFKFVPKASMIELAMKHLGMLDASGNNTGEKAKISWDEFLSSPERNDEKPSNVIDV